MSLSARGRRRLPTTSARNDGQRLDMVGFFIDGSCSISYLLSTCGGEIYVDMRAACKASILVFEAVRVHPERLDAVKRLLDSNIDIRSQAAHLFWSRSNSAPSACASYSVCPAPAAAHPRHACLIGARKRTICAAVPSPGSDGARSDAGRLSLVAAPKTKGAAGYFLSS